MGGCYEREVIHRRALWEMHREYFLHCLHHDTLEDSEDRHKQSERGDRPPHSPFMQGIKRLREAVQKHRENKDINIKYKTPLTIKPLTMPVTHFEVTDPYSYQIGFGAYKETEAVDGALPLAANSPQNCPLGLYAEKLSGTAFTAPRHENQQSWLYRILPSASHQNFEPVESTSSQSLVSPTPSFDKHFHTIPNQLRWDPFDLDKEVSWIHSLHLVAGAGDPTMKQGIGIYIYAAGASMPEKTAFYSADGDFLFVPQHGILDIRTELGQLLVRPNEICVIPRGIRYHIALHNDEPVRGYILELYQGHFALPELGPIGSNCLANARDFQSPVASFIEDYENTEWTLYGKFAGNLFAAKQSHTPFDIVGWHGLYYPYKYDLGRFNPVGSISYDHPDPSIFTVLSAPSHAHGLGTAVADFVIFPPRWLVAEGTFRPPWYHRNTMSEFMGLIGGSYDAKGGGKGGFEPAGASLHNTMSGHGPDMQTFEKASTAPLQPQKIGEGSMAFMFESCLMVGVTEWGLKTCSKVQKTYNEHSWEPLKVHFKRPEGSRGVTNGEKKNRVGDAMDESSVHALR